MNMSTGETIVKGETELLREKYTSESLCPDSSRGTPWGKNLKGLHVDLPGTPDAGSVCCSM